ncbi:MULTISPECIES: hypothetical protein [Haloarcula]|uniref:Uncharacterized protein n=1 Tax=Haloarcula pellucida TaxID=1427151 RepID=A0A830GGE2_9EURY|nr:MULTISPECIES: hypothetical protein [Halomicroarcula]MBX0347023.1 hypothetical protein [Halomicroarcula pellucida]MDS0277102.1 hypothetical protein [Halomicroarcula sp. S1AR25-4]QIO22490.1 hypothetical protein G9465_09080 [Haloarcula sp. JP-L23]GGN86594.1 hypothetical protein GCM10009030_04450 [Halomicroarcula pellucida]
MAMGTLITAAAVLAGINVLLLIPLLGVWVRNYATFRTGLVAGLVAFALAMLVENAVALYFFFSMQSFYAGDPHVQQAVLVLRALQFVAIAGLSYTTLR